MMTSLIQSQSDWLNAKWGAVFTIIIRNLKIKCGRSRSKNQRSNCIDKKCNEWQNWKENYWVSLLLWLPSIELSTPSFEWLFSVWLSWNEESMGHLKLTKRMTSKNRCYLLKKVRLLEDVLLMNLKEFEEESLLNTLSVSSKSFIWTTILLTVLQNKKLSSKKQVIAILSSQGILMKMEIHSWKTLEETLLKSHSVAPSI